MATEKCLIEIQSYQKKLETAKAEEERLYNCRNSSSGELYRMYNKEFCRANNKRYKIEEKIRELEEFGFSTREKTQILNSVDELKTITSDRGLGYRGYHKAGPCKVLGGALISINYTYWTNFMNNVKGCGSMAGKKTIGSLEIITEQQYQELLNSKVTV